MHRDVQHTLLTAHTQGGLQAFLQWMMWRCVLVIVGRVDHSGCHDVFSILYPHSDGDGIIGDLMRLVAFELRIGGSCGLIDAVSFILHLILLELFKA